MDGQRDGWRDTLMEGFVDEELMEGFIDGRMDG